MASQAASTSEATQAALAAILARLEVGLDVPKVVVADIDYPPLPPTGATSKRKTVATKPNPTTTTATTTTTTIATTAATNQPSKDTRFADAVKRRPTHQQLVERQPDFRKAGAAAWLALKRETSVPAHSAPKVELSSGLRLIYASGFPYAKPGDLRKAMQGARIRTSCVWTRPLSSSLKPGFLVPKQLKRISSLLSRRLLLKTSRPSNAVLMSKPGELLQITARTIGGKTLEAATVEATKNSGSNTVCFDISTLETVPRSLSQSDQVRMKAGQEQNLLHQQ
ncbi:hypothetical protein BASA81_017246 [Batrachochytrium salamandrivorans]|nr:hypothetical protein BASA81_017246 [Batrachochytrium salamandrivorans]